MRVGLTAAFHLNQTAGTPDGQQQANRSNDLKQWNQAPAWLERKKQEEYLPWRQKEAELV